MPFITWKNYYIDQMRASGMKELYLSFSGRINRKKYCLGMIPLLIIGVAAAVIDGITGNVVVRLGPVVYGPFQLLSMAVLLVPGLALGIKRLHDRNRIGWFIVLAYVPVVNIWIGIELLFLKGTKGQNEYGDDPLSTELDETTVPVKQPA